MEPITVIIETPKGSGHKYDYEPELKCFKLKKYCQPVWFFRLILGLYRIPKAAMATRWI
jgi:inorganic pyrophosphatase